MRRLPLRFQVSLVVTAIYLAVFGLLGFWQLSVNSKQYFQAEQARLKAQLTALSPSLSISLQFGFTSSIKETVLDLMSQNSELLATRVVQNGEIIFEYGRSQKDLDRLTKPTSKDIYAKTQILSSITPSSQSYDYIESIMSEKNLNLMLSNYYKIALNGFLIFAVALVVINLILARIFKPLSRLANAMGSYKPKSGKLDLDIRSNSPEITTISQSAIDMVSRIESYSDEIIQKDRQMVSKLRQAQMGELLSMIAHQWKQPLSSIGTISANIQLLIELDRFSSDEAVDLLKKIDVHTAYLASTVNDFRNLYKPNKRPKLVNLGELCEKALDLVSATLKRNGITVNTNSQVTRSTFTYPEEILQALLAILKNANDILMDRKVTNPIISIECQQYNDGFEIIVCDNGGGIESESFEKIFDLYFSTKDEKNGTGLGLYMAKMLTEEHCKGELTATNGAFGACFNIFIPRKDAE